MSLPPHLTPQPATAAIHTRRCVRHAHREAAARCPACGGFFCRECVVEHEGRVLCSSCLAKEATTRAQRLDRRATMRRTLSLTTACAVAWLSFYLLGALLLKIPPGFHDGQSWSPQRTEVR